MTDLFEDGSSEFMAHRQHLASATAADELLARVRSRRKQAPPTSPEQAEPDPGVLATAGAIASDVGRGIVEIPRAVVGGALDAAQEAIDLVASVGKWAEEKAGLGGFAIDDKGFRVLSAEELKAKRDAGEDTLTAMRLPDIGDPKSVTGKAIEGISQFVTGFIGAGKIAPFKAATTAGRTGLAAAKGAIADFTVFDPHEARLSDLIQSVPELQNPVTEYLASDPTDSEAEGRFKNAIEGLGLGTLVDGFTLGVRALRQARIARRAQGAIEGAANIDVPRIDPGDMKALGDVEAPLVSIEPSATLRKVGKALDSTTEVKPSDVSAKSDPEMFINFARIDAPEDVQEVMQTMADKFKPAIDGTRRGKQSFKQIELNADQVNAWEALMERRAGQPLNAEQSLAARQLWVTSADKLQQVAKEAAANPSEANLFQFRKMMATHYAIQNEVIAARTETARALASWRIPAGGSAERFRDISMVLEANGGTELSREMADRIAKLAGAGMYGEMDQFVKGSIGARTSEALQEAWIMGLLSGPKTHLVNMMSNSAVILQQMYERSVAARIGLLLGDEGSVQLGEATAQWFGMTQSWKDALRYARKAWKTGETGMGMSKVELPRAGAISSEALGMSSEGWAGRAVDGIGTIVRTPGRALAAEDEFFKTIGYRMELNAQAVRQATREVNSGLVPADGLKARIADILENPPEHIRMAAVDQATYQTFTNTPGNIAKALQKMTADYPVMKVLLPFVRTPANILRYTFERTPLAPLMSHVRADVAAGGARRDLALARMATGTALMMTAADMAMSGQLSGGGPVDPAQRSTLMRSGWQPYSVKVGDRWFALNRLDPLGSLFGMPADMVEILVNTDTDDPNYDAEEAAVAIAAAIGSNVMNKTYLSGLAEFFEAMADPRARAEGFAQRLAGSVVPALSGEIARGQDPYAREVFTMLDAMKRKIPGASEDLPIRRDMWGRPISYRSGLGVAYDAFSPVYSRKEDPEPIDTELLRLEAPIRMPSKRVTFDGVIVDLDRYPGAYSRYLELSGNALKSPAWGMGAKDLMNAIVTGKHPLAQVYALRTDGPDGSKAEMIQDLMNDYRQQARRELLQEFPAMRAEVDDRKEQRRALKMPVMN